LGAALLSRGDDAGAESEFRAALRIRPNLADVQNDLGSLLAASHAQ
jgi:Flp pilus assembly protein TadD